MVNKRVYTYIINRQNVNKSINNLLASKISYNHRKLYLPNDDWIHVSFCRNRFPDLLLYTKGKTGGSGT